MIINNCHPPICDMLFFLFQMLMNVNIPVMGKIPTAATHVVTIHVTVKRDSLGQEMVLIVKVWNGILFQEYYCDLVITIFLLIITDVDDCEVGHLCNNTTEMCTNIEGSYICECKEGYENNTQCEGMYIHVIKLHWVLSLVLTIPLIISLCDDTVRKLNNCYVLLITCTPLS